MAVPTGMAAVFVWDGRGRVPMPIGSGDFCRDGRGEEIDVRDVFEWLFRRDGRDVGPGERPCMLVTGDFNIGRGAPVLVVVLNEEITGLGPGPGEDLTGILVVVSLSFLGEMIEVGDSFLDSRSLISSSLGMTMLVAGLIFLPDAGVDPCT
jgi:hypothetical protein